MPARRCAWTTRFASNVGETEADRVAMELRVERLSAEVENRPLNITEAARKAAPNQASNEESLYLSRRQQLRTKSAAATTTAATPAGTARIQLQAGPYRNSLSLLRQEIGMSEPLVATGRGLASRSAAPQTLRSGNPRYSTAPPWPSPRRGGHQRSATQIDETARQIPQRSPDSTE
jgi:hypothetical protein